MGFFESHLTTNFRAGALSIILLNYNCGVTSYVLMIRNRIETIGVDSYTFATISLLLGLLLGQILFGIFGDTLGRRSSFFMASSLLVLGSVLSVFSSGSGVFEFSLFRFIVGLGAGGMYPLVAAITRETSSQEDLAETNIALVFGPFGSCGKIVSYAPYQQHFKYAICTHCLSIGLVAAPLIVYLMTGNLYFITTILDRIYIFKLEYDEFYPS